MSKSNKFFKEVKEKISDTVEKQKQLWTEDQHKAKAVLESMKEESINNFEKAKENIQKHIEEVQTFTHDMNEHIKNQPMDLKSLSKIVTKYQFKQLEIISDSAKAQTKKLAELQQKLVAFYNEKKDEITSSVKDSKPSKAIRSALTPASRTAKKVVKTNTKKVAKKAVNADLNAVAKKSVKKATKKATKPAAKKVTTRSKSASK